MTKLYYRLSAQEGERTFMNRGKNLSQVTCLSLAQTCGKVVADLVARATVCDAGAALRGRLQAGT